jgi:2-amino-4-hydroxy-6-hydroxymethyldihydropteridine diphosphokinase
METTVYIALGSNLGDRQGYLNQALKLLGDHPRIRLGRLSSVHETDPVGGPAGQEVYLNAAAEMQTDLSPDELLAVLLQVERHLGRVRGERYGPRTIDLDLLLYGDLVQATADLVVPHPRMHQRLFVLGPLSEIAAQVRHPRLGVTVKRLRANLERPRSPVLAGLRALVTGSTSGIGRALAQLLAEKGAWVIIHGYRYPEQAQALAKSLGQLDVATQSLCADLRDPDQCRRLALDGWQIWDGLDIWVNCAGADTLTGEAARWPFDRKLAELLAVDVQAPIQFGRAIGQRMKEQGSGVLLNMGWDQAETGMEGDSGQLFAACKGAIMSFTKSLALTLAPQVRVNCLAPGWIKTAWGEEASGVWQDRVRRETPLGRWGTPEDVAAAALWLLSPEASFITGQVIRVNGGAVR